ncbi:MAG: hypothetical protein FWG98_11530 [Candidatus Cloacimonetes bacterium]|nr:hypothetical protein [Candidatus Cloacimonadota bacterium]
MNTSFKIFLTLILISLGISEIYSQPPPIVNALKSAVIPGWGELSMGNKTGYIFLAAEATLWSTRFYFQSESDLKLRQADQFAFNRANLRSFDLNDDLRFKMERYNQSGFGPGGYNESVLNEAMTINDPEMRDKFLKENLLDERIFWDWGNQDTRVQYRRMRSESMDFDDYAKAIGGTIIVNHIISFFNAMRIANKENHRSNVTIYSGFDREMTPFLGAVVLF